MWAVQSRKPLAIIVFSSQQGGKEKNQKAKQNQTQKARSQLEAPSSFPDVYLTLGNRWGSGASSKTSKGTLLLPGGYKEGTKGVNHLGSGHSSDGLEGLESERKP